MTYYLFIFFICFVKELDFIFQVCINYTILSISYVYYSIFLTDDNFVFKRPLDFGADMVFHSLTKYMNGKKCSFLFSLNT